MSRAGIEQILYLLSEAFEGSREHSLLANLRSLEAEDWRWLPPAGERSILQIVRHIGECKFMYDNHAFGDASMTWNTVPTIADDVDAETAIGWLREGHTALATSVAALSDDEELLKLRRANWGMEYQTRWLVNVMIQHDIYHGGEINHIRALRQKNDAWPDYGAQ